MAQMQTISIRIPDEDFQWLLALQEPGAKTPSERLRALLARARQQEAGMSDPELCSAWMRGLVQPLVDSVAALERRHARHSEVVSAIAERVPQIMATLASSRMPGDGGPDAPVGIEALLTRQCMQLFTTLLRTAVTSTPPTYDRNVLNAHLPDIIELAGIISTRLGKESSNG